ncbi:hypothetical protein EK21DRAFT_39146, partial [Setomelanomma holmii]
HIEALGWRTYNNPDGVVNRPIFKFEPIIRLYKVELSHLFGILLRDEGAVLNREDPMLFDKELEKLLHEYGPLVWPHPENDNRNRQHLRDAQAETLYEQGLMYPRDVTILKDRMRHLILAKRANSSTNVQALIGKRHKDARLKVLKTTGSSASTGSSRKRARGSGVSRVPRSSFVSYDSSLDIDDDDDTNGDSESEDSVIGYTPRQRAPPEAAKPQSNFSRVELRLYRRTSISGPYGPVKPYGPWFLTSDCATAHKCFTRLCQEIKTDCSFMVFRLPEDMSMNGSVRVNRGAVDAEPKFQRVLEIFRKAKKFPGVPQYRSVEVEVGLD